LAIRPDAAAVHSDLLFNLHYDPAYSARQLYSEHVAWADRHARQFYPDTSPPKPDSVAPRRLRVGYVSAHLRGHPVTRFFEPVLQHHDRAAFEVFCYSDVVDPDSTTARLKAYGHVWRDVQGTPDERVAQTIREDQIDILVDLTGHMGGHRLLVFARKPAPVQVTYLGYPNTTGLATMDFRITDFVHDPPGTTEPFHTETLYRLDPCCWCYLPDEGDVAIQEPPSSVTGSVTFAALNKLLKVTPTMIRTWSLILDALPGSLLMTLASESAAADPSIRELFERNGIASDRLVTVGRMSRERYLRQYQSADVALDTFPYNGHTTTCDALWMGVPVVTLAGDTHVSRAGLDVLTTVGLEALVTRTPDQYVRVAVDLARDRPRLNELRRTLRQRMRASPLCDAPGFTRRLEEAYRRMYHGPATPAEI
jgi:predicted O-linked N-acetylglucosamine transferase (SPINDLY family)